MILSDKTKYIFFKVKNGNIGYHSLTCSHDISATVVGIVNWRTE